MSVGSTRSMLVNTGPEYFPSLNRGMTVQPHWPRCLPCRLHFLMCSPSCIAETAVGEIRRRESPGDEGDNRTGPWAACLQLSHLDPSNAGYDQFLLSPAKNDPESKKLECIVETLPILTLQGSRPTSHLSLVPRLGPADHRPHRQPCPGWAWHVEWSATRGKGAKGEGGPR